MFDKSSLLTTCITDYCTCSNVLKPEKCACDGVSVLAKDCTFSGIKMEHGWRDLNICRKNLKSFRNNNNHELD